MFSTDYEQLALFEQVSTLTNLSFEQPLKFLGLLKEHFHLAAFIPNSFYNHYYSSLGTGRDYGLESMLSAFIIKNLLHIPTISLLRMFIVFSPYIQDFCHFSAVPDESVFSRFKSDFESDILSLFDNMVPSILGICSSFDGDLPQDDPLKGLSSTLIYDTSGLKPMVKENNPKTLPSEIKRFKAYAKTISNKNFNPYAAAYKNMPKFAAANHQFKLDFVNGHFGYFYKFGMLTNGFGIPLSIHFFDEASYKSLPADFETPEDQKYCFTLKKDPSIDRPRTLNTASLRSDLYFAAISKLIVVILAHAINKPEFMRNISAVMQAA